MKPLIPLNAAKLRLFLRLDKYFIGFYDETYLNRIVIQYKSLKTCKWTV